MLKISNVSLLFASTAVQLPNRLNLTFIAENVPLLLSKYDPTPIVTERPAQLAHLADVRCGILVSFEFVANFV